MPLYQAIVEKTNVALNRENVENINPAWFAPGTNLAIAASQAASINPAAEANPNLNFTSTEQGVINGLPEVIKEVLRAAVYAALGNNDGALPVQLVWMPGYDFEVSITAAPGIKNSIGGVNIVLRTRYHTDLAIPGVQ